jgi:uncharacterized protein
MPRPKKCRCIDYYPRTLYFKPRGIPMFRLEETVLDMDEVEAIRLADYEGLYQEDAAQKMDVSRATFGRILNSARRKLADAVINGKALKIESISSKEEENNESLFCSSK